METEKKCQSGWCRSSGKCDGGNLVWFLGAIGAAVYYLGLAETFGQGVIAFLKALAWPAFLVFKLLTA